MIVLSSLVLSCFVLGVGSGSVHESSSLQGTFQSPVNATAVCIRELLLNCEMTI